MPASFAACQIVVPSGTVRSRPSMVRLTVRISVGAGVEMATVCLSVYVVGPGWVYESGTYYVSADEDIPDAQVRELGRRRPPLLVEPTCSVVPVDHGIEARSGERRRAAGGDLERLGQEPLRQAVVGSRPALARVERP